METKLDIGNDGLWGVLDSKKEELKSKDKIKFLFLDCDGAINIKEVEGMEQLLLIILCHSID